MKDVLKRVLDYIKENHPDAAIVPVDEVCFTAGSDSKKVLGYRKTVYSGGGWNIKIGHPLTLEIVYNIEAIYNDGEIVWSGRVINGRLEELSYENIKPG